MNKLIDNWNYNTLYQELDKIKFINEAFYLRRSEKKLSSIGEFPVKNEVITNGVVTIKKSRFLDDLSRELSITNFNNNDSWKKIKL